MYDDHGEDIGPGHCWTAASHVLQVEWHVEEICPENPADEDVSCQEDVGGAAIFEQMHCMGVSK